MEVTSINNLPNELLAKIMDSVSFKDLFMLERSNKKIRNIVMNLVLNRKTSLDFAYIRMYSDILKIIAKNCPMLEKINLKHCFDGEELDDGLKFLFEKCPNINYLNLYANDVFHGGSFEYIPTQLKYLNLWGCDKITSSAMEILSNRAQNLETLILDSFSSERNNANEWLEKLCKIRFLQLSNFEDNDSLNFSNMNDLEMLCLRGNSTIGDESFRSLQHCRKLTSLDLSCNFYSLKACNLEILKECKSLKVCDFSKSWNLWNIVEFVQAIQIQSLALNYCEALPEDIVKSLISDCDSLSMLEIGGSTTPEISPLSFYEECQKRKCFIKVSINRMDKIMEDLLSPTKLWEINEFKYPSLSDYIEIGIENNMNFN